MKSPMVNYKECQTFISNYSKFRETQGKYFLYIHVEQSKEILI